MHFEKSSGFCLRMSECLNMPLRNSLLTVQRLLNSWICLLCSALNVIAVMGCAWSLSCVCMSSRASSDAVLWLELFEILLSKYLKQLFCIMNTWLVIELSSSSRNGLLNKHEIVFNVIYWRIKFVTFLKFQIYKVHICVLFLIKWSNGLQWLMVL